MHGQQNIKIKNICFLAAYTVWHSRRCRPIRA